MTPALGILQCWGVGGLEGRAFLGSDQDGLSLQNSESESGICPASVFPRVQLWAVAKSEKPQRKSGSLGERPAFVVNWVCVHQGVKVLEKPASLIHRFFHSGKKKSTRKTAYGEAAGDQNQKHNMV